MAVSLRSMRRASPDAVLGGPNRKVPVHAIALVAEPLGPIELDDLLAHNQVALGQVHVRPAQPCRLTATHAGGGDQLEDRRSSTSKARTRPVLP